MINKLAVVGISSLAICVICIGAAAAIGGNALRDAGFDFSGMDRPRCDFQRSGQPSSRSFPWDGDDSVSIQIPATVHYRTNSGYQVVVTGDSAVLQHVRVANGKVRLDCRGERNFIEQLDITLPGRVFKTFALAGTGNLILDGINQPDLKIRLAGSGDIDANGKTDNLDVAIAGSGLANLGSLEANRVVLKLAGNGNAEIAPKDELDVHIAGSGKVTLRTEPQEIETHIAGSGEIVHAAQP